LPQTRCAPRSATRGRQSRKHRIRDHRTGPSDRDLIGPGRLQSPCPISGPTGSRAARPADAAPGVATRRGRGEAAEDRGPGQLGTARSRSSARGFRRPRRVGGGRRPRRGITLDASRLRTGQLAPDREACRTPLGVPDAPVVPGGARLGFLGGCGSILSPGRGGGRCGRACPGAARGAAARGPDRRGRRRLA